MIWLVLALAGLTMCFRFVHVAVALPELHNRVIMETNTIPDTFPPNPSLKTLETTARFIPVSYPILVIAKQGQDFPKS